MPPSQRVPASSPSGEQVRLRAGEHEVTVVTVGGGLRTYRLGDWDVVDGYGEDEMCSAGRGQALIPWPNRLRDGRYRFAGAELQLPLSEPPKLNAIHGLVRWLDWEVAESSSTSATMRCRLYPQAGYPFKLLLLNEYRLGEAGLTVRTTAANHGREPCPYACGFHPYLSVGEDRIDTAIVRAPGHDWMPADDRQIPTGRSPVAGTEYDFRRPRVLGATRMDTAFADLEREPDGLAVVEMRSADGSRRVRLWMDGSYDYLMLFTGDTLEPARRRRGLGVEPMTCAPNAFQTGEGLVSLAPGESLTSTWGISPASGLAG